MRKNDDDNYRTELSRSQQQQQQQPLHPAIAAGLGTFFLINVGALLSLPPVLMGRGAPYLPTFTKNMDSMFHQLKNEPRFRHRISGLQSNKYYYNQQQQQQQQQQQPNNEKSVSIPSKNWLLYFLKNPSTLSTKMTSVGTPDSAASNADNRIQQSIQQQAKNARDGVLKEQQQQQEKLALLSTNKKLLVFVDLGSGDGRLVFRAAQEGIFDVCIGYEINPFLHILACAQRYIHKLKMYWNIRSSPNSTTDVQFFLRDLWNVNLQDVDVVAVYGLGPIMKDLGVKLKHELKPGSYVLSNVFSIPDWKPISSSAEGTYIYRIPDLA